VSGWDEGGEGGEAAPRAGGGGGVGGAWASPSPPPSHRPSAAARACALRSTGTAAAARPTPPPRRPSPLARPHIRWLALRAAADAWTRKPAALGGAVAEVEAALAAPWARRVGGQLGPAVAAARSGDLFFRGVRY